MATLTLRGLKSLLKKRAGGVLKSGKHSAPNGKCEVCVRELRCLALGLPWSDHPDGESASPTDKACQRLNDANWSSDAARTEACLPLALLSEETAANGWVDRYIDRTIREIVPIALRAAAKRVPKHAGKLETAAKRCEAEGKAAIRDAADAAYAAANAAANAANAAYAAAYAANAAYANAAYANAAYANAANAAYAANAANAAYANAANAAYAYAYADAAYAANAAYAYAYADAAYAANAAYANAANAAYAYAYAYADAAYAAAYAAYAATADARDEVLRKSVAILIECQRGE